MVARYGIVQANPSIWAIAAINVGGSFLLGILAASELPATMKDGLGIGVLGGLTTFSTFSVQALLEADAGRPLSAFAYVTGSVGLGIAAAAIGYYAVKHAT